MAELLSEFKFNPTNSISAIIYFLFGSFLVWWTYDKIPTFTSIFTNTGPRVIIWTTFIFLYGLWTLFIPYLCITGKPVSVIQFFKTFTNGLIGVLMIIVMLPIMQTMMTALSFIFSNAILAGLAWLLSFISIFYFAYYKPIMILYEK